MDRLIEKVNSSQSLNLFNNPVVSFSNTIDNLKVYNSRESNNNGNDKIIEFLSAKKRICNSGIRNNMYLKQSIKDISKFIDNKTAMILNIDYKLILKIQIVILMHLNLYIH